MLRNHRGILFALVGCLIGLQAQHDAKAQEPTANQVQPGKGTTAAEIERLPSAETYQPRCDRPKNWDESDLCAQWGAVIAARQANALAAEANRAAQKANIVSANTLRWTQAGIVAVLLTLIATAWAAWSAGVAARAANRSVDLFQAAEAGQLVPHLSIDAYDVVTVTLRNVGRTAVSVLHADLCCVDARPTKPLGAFFTEGVFSKDALIAPGDAYTFAGPMRIPNASPKVWLLGGAIYRTQFANLEVAKVAIYLDRASGAQEVDHKVSFAEWEAMAKKVQDSWRT